MIGNVNFLLVAVLVGIITAPSAHAADTFRKLSTAEIKSKIAGMEITDEVHWADLFQKDETFASYSMGKKRTGKWFARNNELCLDNGKEPADCNEIWMSGNKVEYRNPRGTPPLEAVLIKQQPRS